MPLDPNILRQPGVSVGLRRMAAAQAGGYGSIASRADPNNYGSIASRQNPGVFGPGADLTGRAAMQAQQEGLIRQNSLDLTLRNQNFERQQDPEQALALQRLRQQYGLRLTGRNLAQFSAGNIFGGDNEDAGDDGTY